MQIDKLPPQALEFEEAVLGAILIQKDCLDIAEDYITGKSFYKDEHRLIFEACKTLSKENKPIDILSVANELKEKGKLAQIGGPYAISQLTNRVASGALIAFHSAIIQQKFLERELIRVSTEAIKTVYEGDVDVFELLERSEQKISKLSEHKGVKDFSAPEPIIKEILKRNDILLDKTKVLGVTSGFKKLDDTTAGWQNSDLIILAGRPGMGKTSFALSLAINAAMAGNPIAFFSVEMSQTQITSRALSVVSEVPLEDVLRRGVQGQKYSQLQKGIAIYENLPIYIDDTGSIPITELKKKARKAKKEKGIKIIFIDYLHLVTDNSEKSFNQEQKISSISKQLKSLAKELDLPIIVLSQLNRGVEGRGSNVPKLSDLRDSGAIEQDADMVIFLYRPEYYGLEEFEGMNAQGLAIAIIAKHRNGALEDIRLGFKAELTKFTNYGEVNNYSLQPNEAF